MSVTTDSNSLAVDRYNYQEAGVYGPGGSRSGAYFSNKESRVDSATNSSREAGPAYRHVGGIGYESRAYPIADSASLGGPDTRSASRLRSNKM